MASRSKRQKSTDSYKLLYGTCPDEECQAKLYFPSYDKSIECTNCGQRHERSTIKNIAEVTNPNVALHNLLKNVLLGNVKPKKGADNVKVLGLSNYVCKLISPILTHYGIDRETGKAKLLSDMGKGEVFDVSILGDRAFLIEEENLEVIGYGQDRSGSLQYLGDTLKDITAFNDGKTCLVPIHADGDGHCLVHAVSRALVGRELFWHALRVNLKYHLENNLDKYKNLFRDFIDVDEWECIIEECDPYYIPPFGEAHGLRNIHIFGLANILHRPIILLDSKTGMSSSGDYSGVFLPGLIPPDECRGKDGSLNKPLCIAWSSLGRNHYIPVVPVKGRGPARLPSYMVQKSWGMPCEEIHKYIQFDTMFRCHVGGDKCLTDKYLRNLVCTMEEVFKERYNVNPGLVADVHQYIYKSTGIVGVHPDEVIERTKNAVAHKQLYRCLMCDALVEYVLAREMFDKGGNLYNLAVKIHKKLDPTKLYSFPEQGAVCSYDADQDSLIPNMERSQPKTCAFCQGAMLRRVVEDSTVVYMDGDRTSTPCTGGKCPCGFKHYWQGKEYDNLPDILPVSLSWGGKTLSENVAWFQYENDPSHNSNVFEEAQGLVQKHFPGEWGSERLVQRVVDSILAQTAIVSKDEGKKDCDKFGDGMDTWSADTASKIILTGHKKKTMHKEELTKSDKEKAVRKNIEANAAKVQHRKTTEIALANQKAAQAKVKASQSTGTIKPGAQPVASTSVVSQSSGVQGTIPTTNTDGEKKVKLATSDGRQVMLTLVKDVTYYELQKLIYEAVSVPSDRQKIRQGFPPKILHPPGEGQRDTVVPLTHGDKLSVEILPDTSQPPPDMLRSPPAAASKAPVTSWSNFTEDTTNTTADSLLQALKDASHTGDNLDTSIASLGIMAAVSGKDMWTYVQAIPHLFSVGGLLYNQVKRDLGLTDGKHCQLPCLPGKIFRYNGAQDRLELCLEPYGHFPVEPNIERKVKDTGLGQQESAKGQEEVKFGASGAIHHGQERKAFSGQGHSMITADEHMPVDLELPGHGPHARGHGPHARGHGPHARGFHDLCGTPGHSGDTIAEEPDMQVDEDSSKEAVKYERLGPGYTVINQTGSSTDNTNLEMFRALAQSIEETLSQNMEQDDQEETSTQQLEVTNLNDKPEMEVAKQQESSHDVTMETNHTDNVTIVTRQKEHTESDSDTDNVPVSVISVDSSVAMATYSNTDSKTSAVTETVMTEELPAQDSTGEKDTIPVAMETDKADTEILTGNQATDLEGEGERGLEAETDVVMEDTSDNVDTILATVCDKEVTQTQLSQRQPKVTQVVDELNKTDETKIDDLKCKLSEQGKGSIDSVLDTDNGTKVTVDTDKVQEAVVDETQPRSV